MQLKATGLKIECVLGFIEDHLDTTYEVASRSLWLAQVV